MTRTGLLLFMSLTIAGCGPGDKKAGPTDLPPPPTNLDTKIPTPKGFPDDVPFYPSLNAVSNNSKGDVVRFTLFTSDPREKVVAFYESKLKESGWTMGPTEKLGHLILIQGVKADRRCTALVDKDNVQVTVAKK